MFFATKLFDVCKLPQIELGARNDFG